MPKPDQIMDYIDRIEWLKYSGEGVPDGKVFLISPSTISYLVKWGFTPEGAVKYASVAGAAAIPHIKADVTKHHRTFDMRELLEIPCTFCLMWIERGEQLFITTDKLFDI